MIITTRYDLGKLAQHHNVTGRAAMIGIQYGAFEKEIGKDYKGVIHCIDLWQDESIYQTAVKNLCEHGPNHATYYLHRKASLDAVSFFEYNSLDMVYIDANHFYNEVLADMNAWFPKVRSGGIFAGHDYCHYTDIEVIPAVNEWCEKHGYTFYLTTSERDSWNGVMFPSWIIVKR